MDGSTTPAAAKRDGAAAMRIAVLQHTHTAKPAYIFRRAREQIVQWRAGHSPWTTTSLFGLIMPSSASRR